MQINNGWVDTAVEVDCLNKSMSRQGYNPTMICIHGTAGGSSAQAIGEYFQTTPLEVSSNLVIDQAGNLVQCVPFTLAAWANGAVTSGHANYIDPNINPNYYTISIEHVKSSTDNSNTLTDAQKAMSFQVIKLLCETYNIPKSTYLSYSGSAPGIVRHADIDPVNRSGCPGPYPWQDLLTFLNAPTAQQEKYMQQQMTDQWNALGIPTNTGIFASVLAHMQAGILLGPVLTHETKTVNWSGVPIIQQGFSCGWVEWTISSGENHGFSTQQGHLVQLW